MDLFRDLATQLSIGYHQLTAVVELLDAGNTIPFIARYRKEATGSLDDTILRELEERINQIRAVEKRRKEVSASLENLELLTPELTTALEAATTLSALEDIYRPYRPKRRTRASIAKERGLEPLAQLLFAQTGSALAESLAVPFVNPEKEVPTVEDALAGARDIIAEQIADRADVRSRLREFLWREATMVTKGENLTESVYAQYEDYTEPINKVLSHRILAIDRGERENALKVSIKADMDKTLAILQSVVVARGFSPTIDQVRQASSDCLTRLLYPSLERELRAQLTQTAADQAIHVFGLNLRPLLLQPPVRGKVALGLDPGYRTGCKVAVVDSTGKVLETGVIYPTPPASKIAESEKIITRLITQYGVEVVAIGNGTASKETEIFAAGLIQKLSVPVAYMMVSEAGASVYSASKLAAEEFPQFDVSLRSAVSIARRLQDPLAELVKIDPKSIGVGQYQHDMPAAQLDATLGGVVEDCVNQVGVDLNTASHSLLAYVAGIGPALAKNIVHHREENGPFANRKGLMEVPKLGKKAFEQAAGFLRLPQGENPLDNTAVHPESYKAALKLLSLCGKTPNDVQKGDLGGLRSQIATLGEENLAQQLGVGLPTLQDMVDALLAPGRDPRDSLPAPMLRTDVMDMKDLKPDMVLTGTVRNVTDFGAFVDIGVHQDGLVHISQICKEFIKHPSQKLAVGDIVTVRVIEVDNKRGRIGLTMKDL